MKKKTQKCENSSKKIRMERRTFGDIRIDKAAVANITKIHYYDSKLLTRVKCDASHSGLGASLEQQNREGSGYRLHSLPDI